MTDQLPPEIDNCIRDLSKDYSDFEPIDRGGNGYLWFAKNIVSQAEVAIKFYAGETGDRRHDEPRHLLQLRSANILPIHGAGNVSDDWAYFVTPRCNGGDLDDLIKSKPSVHKAINTILGITNGVAEIHSHKMVHRDLKPGNIVLDGDVPRIADFGTVRLLNEESQTTTASQHTPLYRCPESANSNEYSRAGDVYQIGLIAYQLLGGRLDYDLLTYLSPSERKKHDSMDSPIDRSLYVQEVILERAKRERLVDLSSLPPWITLSARRLLRQMTNPDPNERPASTSDIAAEISRLIQRIPDWKFDGDIAKLISQNREFELRPTGTGDYEAYQQIRHGAFRHVPGMKPSALSELVKRFSP